MSFELLLIYFECLICSKHVFDLEYYLADFYNWNRVKNRYYDGASFAGQGQDEVRTTRPAYSSFNFLILL